MFEQNMDEYLDEEVETVKQAFEVISRDWERKVRFFVSLGFISVTLICIRSCQHRQGPAARVVPQRRVS